MIKPFIRGKKIDLFPLTKELSEGAYSDWFNDEDVCFFNGHHKYPKTHDDLIAYINTVNSNRSLLVLAIFNKENKHIGNVSLQNIDFISRSAEFAIIIGEQSSWGKGVGKEACALMLKHAFLTLNVNRVSCGTSEENIGMQNIALSNNIIQEGIRRKAMYNNGKYLDLFEYGILRSEWEFNNK
jgi:RimJ/RimL family protein N-acetyltransferase